MRCQALFQAELIYPQNHLFILIIWIEWDDLVIMNENRKHLNELSQNFIINGQFKLYWSAWYIEITSLPLIPIWIEWALNKNVQNFRYIKIFPWKTPHFFHFFNNFPAKPFHTRENTIPDDKMHTKLKKNLTKRAWLQNGFYMQLNSENVARGAC